MKKIGLFLGAALIAVLAVAAPVKDAEAWWWPFGGWGGPWGGGPWGGGPWGGPWGGYPYWGGGPWGGYPYYGGYYPYYAYPYAVAPAAPAAKNDKK